MRMEKRTNNKGFSLVELIIVIAIMAILVGVLAPVLMRQLEKAKVSSDLSKLETIAAAIEYGCVEQGILEDPTSQALADLIDASVATPLQLSIFENPTYKNCELAKYVRETAGVTDFNDATINKLFKSYRGAGSKIYFSRRGSYVNPIVIWITYSDRTGKKKPAAAEATHYTQITNEVALD